MNQATKLMIELLEDHADHIYSEHTHTEMQLSEFAEKYFMNLVEQKIENDLYGVLLQEVTHLVDWYEVASMIYDKNI